jgi:TonB family protein
MRHPTSAQLKITPRADHRVLRQLEPRARAVRYQSVIHIHNRPASVRPQGGIFIGAIRPGHVIFMSVEARNEIDRQVWPECQGTVINGVYPLRRLLHESEHSAIYLTDGKTHNVPDAAIKLLRTERTLEELQLRRWRTAGALSHPHLIRLLDSGHCQLGTHRFLFVVMEYAEQTLAQVLPHRALSPDEAREMLAPTLDALCFLHRKNLVHGQLKPANFLVVNDQLKLASDAVRHAGEPRATVAGSSLYDAPEVKHGRVAPAGDIWGLGVTIVEALTQSLPWPDEQSGSVSLPSSLPSQFADTIQCCLSIDASRRPTANELAARYNVTPSVQVTPVPQHEVREAVAPTQPPLKPLGRRPSIPIIAVALLALIAVWAGWRVFRHAAFQQTQAAAVERGSQQSAGEPATAAVQSPETPALPTANGSALAPRVTPAHPTPRRPNQPVHPVAEDTVPSVAHVQLPTVSRSALMTIHGHIKVAVLVIVDKSGSVIDALVENPGPSSYFAHLAREAASKWKFAPADPQDTRQWLLSFEFTRGGVTGHATPRS